MQSKKNEFMHALNQQSDKTNGSTRLLIADGRESHVIASFIHFYIDHDIIILLFPSHSSHFIQSLNIDIFSPLKKKMIEQLDHILHYGVSILKKFE